MSKLHVRQAKQEKNIFGRESNVCIQSSQDLSKYINSSLHVLSANHLFGNCAENKSLELLK